MVSKGNIAGISNKEYFKLAHIVSRSSRMKKVNKHTFRIKEIIHSRFFFRFRIFLFGGARNLTVILAKYEFGGERLNFGQGYLNCKLL